MMRSILKFNPFSIVTTLLSILCFSSSAAALIAEPPLSEAAFIIACLFWLCLPLAHLSRAVLFSLSLSVEVFSIKQRLDDKF